MSGVGPKITLEHFTGDRAGWSVDYGRRIYEYITCPSSRRGYVRIYGLTSRCDVEVGLRGGCSCNAPRECLHRKLAAMHREQVAAKEAA